MSAFTFVFATPLFFSFLWSPWKEEKEIHNEKPRDLFTLVFAYSTIKRSKATFFLSSFKRLPHPSEVMQQIILPTVSTFAHLTDNFKLRKPKWKFSKFFMRLKSIDHAQVSHYIKPLQTEVGRDKMFPHFTNNNSVCSTCEYSHSIRISFLHQEFLDILSAAFSIFVGIFWKVCGAWNATDVTQHILGFIRRRVWAAAKKWQL